MDIYKINNDKDISQKEDTVLVLGYFDGMHLGHQALFTEARKIAAQKNLKIAVLTFPESPQLAFIRYKPDLLFHLNGPEERFRRFEEAGVDCLYLIDFTSSFAATTAEDFMTNYVQKLKARALVAGFDYRFARNQKTSSYLKDVFDGQVVIVPEFCLDGDKVSSTRIRQLVLQGCLAEAHRLLGYPFSTRGLVVHGDARGRMIGYPTANLAPLDRVYLPADGVYVADVEVSGQLYRGMASIGKNVTFDGTDLRLEAHIFDFEGDLYGQTIRIHWLDKIRDMIRFTGAEALAAQLADDENIARMWKSS